ncbi:topoisomerase II [Mumia sp. zg.B17]|uniref:DUF5926 family protein n=1 Tax=unclassified Mumia TaxID=2621872 RepID=UPI001C6EDC7B|nr:MULTISPECIES: DUF5926 family protein [unclassified Mumia]MBW9207629.1 topoisomerase II [Mumia sp. zg.B17]MBW9210026.1 topoisomerase II [Mumia sp. zg.B21]MDD9348882.1 DUF5926 family protein [Mumia sp.]
MGKRSRRRVKPEKAERVPFRARTFEGLPGECDWVALREFVPSATATVALRPDVAESTTVRVCTLLPGASAGLVRPDGELWLGLQVTHNFGDVSRDLAAVVEQGLETEPGTEIVIADPGAGRRLQDLVDPESDFPVDVQDGFDFWTAGVDDPTGAVAGAIEQANEVVTPTERLEEVDAAYWTQLGERQFLRWVMPHDEDKLLTALARLHVSGDDRLADDVRLIGSFRAHGLLVPVWEMLEPTPAVALEGPAAAFESRLEEALADSSPLTSEQRGARNGLANRQITVR